jgi:hypothetical protein
MRIFSLNSNALVVFRQGTKNEEYLYHLYELFKPFVKSPPSIYTIEDKLTGKVRQNISFATLSLPCFNEFYENFYVNKIKIVPSNIEQNFTKISLAYWIMDNGSFSGSGIKLYTAAFSMKDLELLIKILHKNLGIKATINIHNKDKNQYSLYISKNQLDLVKSLVKEYMHPSMMYILGEK